MKVDWSAEWPRNVVNGKVPCNTGIGEYLTTNLEWWSDAQLIWEMDYQRSNLVRDHNLQTVVNIAVGRLKTFHWCLVRNSEIACNEEFLNHIIFHTWLFAWASHFFVRPLDSPCFFENLPFVSKDLDVLCLGKKFGEIDTDPGAILKEGPKLIEKYFFNLSLLYGSLTSHDQKGRKHCTFLRFGGNRKNFKEVLGEINILCERSRETVELPDLIDELIGIKQGSIEFLREYAKEPFNVDPLIWYFAILLRTFHTLGQKKKGEVFSRLIREFVREYLHFCGNVFSGGWLFRKSRINFADLFKIKRPVIRFLIG